MKSVHGTLTRLYSGMAEPTSEKTQKKPTPIQIRKSVTPDGIVSFVDGKTYKTLKRHLTSHGFDPQSYRQRYGLSADYPMVAPNYTSLRSALAKSSRLGHVSDRSEKPQQKPRKTK